MRTETEVLALLLHCLNVTKLSGINLELADGREPVLLDVDWLPRYMVPEVVVGGLGYTQLVIHCRDRFNTDDEGNFVGELEDCGTAALFPYLVVDDSHPEAGIHFSVGQCDGCGKI